MLLSAESKMRYNSHEPGGAVTFRADLSHFCSFSTIKLILKFFIKM